MKCTWVIKGFVWTLQDYMSHSLNSAEGGYTGIIGEYYGTYEEGY